MEITSRAKRLTPFHVMELLEAAREMEAQGEEVVHLEIGEPDFPLPGPVREAALKAIRDNRTFYTHSLGLPELRARVARYYSERHNVTVPPGRIIITNGTSGAFLLLCAVLLDRDSVLAVPDPGYPCYRNFGTLFDAGLLPVPVSEETRFELTAGALARAHRKPRMVIISNPSNPTGTLTSSKTIGGLHGFLTGNGGCLVVDELYEGLVYGSSIKTALSLADDIIVVNGFSKTYAMMGLRLGWMVVPEGLVRPIQTVAQNVFISPPTISQYAALSAFDAAVEIEEMRRTYEERRDFFVPRLRDLGFRIPVGPEGAFYVYAGIKRWEMDSAVFVHRALREAKVAITHGYDFGSFRAGEHVRFSYASGLEKIIEGCNRLELWLKGLG